MSVAQKKSDPIKRIAQALFVIYVFVLYMFSFQTAFVDFTEYIFLAFAGVVVVYIAVKKKILFAKEHYYLLAFCFLSFLTTIWSIDFNTTLTSSISLLLLAGMSILVYQVFDKQDVNILLKAVFYAGIALVVTTAINAGFVEYMEAILTGKRLGGAMNAPNTFGVYCSVSFILGLHLLKKKKVYYGLLLVVIFSGILASGSRNAFIITAIGSLISIFFAFKNLASSKKALYIIIFLALVLLVYNLGFFDSIFSRIENLDRPSGADSSEDPSLQSRLFMIKFGFERFFSRPIFGYGINNAQFLLEDYFARTYLHNNYIELLVDVGLVGFVLYYINHVTLIKQLMKNRKGSLDIYEIIFTVFVVLLIADMSIVFYYNKLTYIILTMAMVVSKGSAKETIGESLDARK